MVPYLQTARHLVCRYASNDESREPKYLPFYLPTFVPEELAVTMSQTTSAFTTFLGRGSHTGCPDLPAQKELPGLHPFGSQGTHTSEIRSPEYRIKSIIARKRFSVSGAVVG
jgi:hypothetical protein